MGFPEIFARGFQVGEPDPGVRMKGGGLVMSAPGVGMGFYRVENLQFFD